ncbi:MAG: haloacid dehalogenase, partial [Candidatus Dormibacteraeota bacterium]|nr:haloacid dehalogenase [Candidatus Dormibacteraeota bacterium]
MIERVIRALVFDFDGLILDSEGPVFQAWSEVYRRYGQELSESFWVTIIGRSPGFFDPFTELERLVGRSLDRDALQ